MKIVLTDAIVAATTTRSTSAQWSRKRTATGSFATSVRSNTGVSSSLRRMTNPTTTTAALHQNGTRQPHVSSWSCGSAATGRKIAVARIWPACVPLRVKLVKYARRRSGACSSDIEFAPACSPAAESPCSSRKTTSRIGASTPTAPYVGRQPTANVAAPISSSVNTRTRLRPKRSPTWPRMNAPTGRAR